MKSVLLFSVLSLALMNAGCAGDDKLLSGDEDGNLLQPLSIQAAVLTPESVLSGSRAIVYGTEFPDLSKIGVHVAKGVSTDASGNQGAPGTPYSADYLTNQMFHFDGTIWSADDPYNLSADKGTVYAYYPYDSGVSFNTPGDATVPVVIQPTGSIGVLSGSAATDNINNSGAITSPAEGEKDFMYYAPGASRAIVSNRQHSVMLTMQHVLAQVSFCLIKSSNYPGAGNFTQYEIYDTGATSHVITGAASSVMSIVDGSLTIHTPAKGTVTRSITNYHLGSDLSQATIVSNLVFPASAIAAGDVSVKFHIDAQDYIAPLPVTAGLSDEWSAGKNYLYSVTLSGKGIEITSVSIVDWDNIDAGEIE